MSALHQKLSEKTDSQLLYYIDHVNKHTEEAVRLALHILQERNVTLPEGTAERIESELAEVKEHSELMKIDSWKRNVVNDQEAPEYYSQTAIYVFSILFSVFFGSFMLAANCKDAGKKGWQVIVAGFAYTAITLIIMNAINVNFGFLGTYVINAIGVMILYQLFWKRDIGSETKYRAKPIWKPLLIAAIIFIPVVYFILTNAQ